jgi:site-specific recombinase XerD
MAELRNDGVKPWAARHALDVLDYALNYAIRLKLINANPCHTIDKPRPRQAEVGFLTPEQTRLVREMSAGFPVKLLLEAALGTGCRQGELLGLR